MFKVRFLGFLELFSNSHLEHLWPPWIQPSLLPRYHENHLIWVNSSLMTFLEVSLALSAFDHCLRGPASLPDCPKNNLTWVDSIRTVSLGLHADFPLELLFRTVYAILYIVCLLYIVYILFPNEFFCNYSNIILILEMYSRYFDPRKK
jgi:hypothetical protein